VQGNLIDTQRKRFGAVIGDGVRTGVNTCVYPGRKIGPGRMTNPNATVEKDLMSSRITGRNSVSFQI
jgi:acetyltransferase-like isoleucine patch superfamily enzyme